MKVSILAAAFALVAGSASAATYVDFEGLAAGTAVNSLSAGGVGITVSTNSRGSVDQAIVFDTKNATGGDTDLQGPFKDASGTMYDPGNVLIISENTNFSNPDDERRGGTITFTFDTAIDFYGFKGFDDIRVDVTSNAGDSTSLSVAKDNMWGQSNVNWLGVTSLTFDLSGSGAIDELKFEVSAVPVPAAGVLLLTAVGGLGFAARRRKG